MKLLFLSTLCAAAFHQSQGHFFGRAEPHESLTVSLRTSTEIAIPTQVSTITRVTTQPAVTMTQDRHHTVVETQAVPVTRTAWVSNPPVTFTQVQTATATAIRTATVVAHKTHTATSILHETNHIQPTVSVYELGAHAQVPSVPHNAVLKKRVVMDVLVGETNAIVQDATLHSGATSHSLGLLCTVGTFVAAMMI